MASDTYCKVILANTIAKSILQEVQQGLKTLNGRRPHLRGILANKDEAAQVYAKWTKNTCEENGFTYTLSEVDKDDVEDSILTANNDQSIDGIIVYYPIHNNRQDQYLQECVSLSKDVEGLTHKYIFNMYQNIRFLDPEQLQKSILPCTPLAVVKVLEYLHIYNTILPYGNRLFGHTILVVNRSEVVGRPLAALLANDGATVYSVDIDGVQKFTRGEGLRKRKHEVEELPKSTTMADVAGLCEVVITGVPGEKFKFDTSLLKDGAVCINFSSEKNFPPSVKQKASIYVPAIGKVTIAVLLRNLLRITQNRELQEQRSAAAAASAPATGTVVNAKPVVNGVSAS